MNKLLIKHRINKIYQLSRSSEIFEYIIKCYNNRKLDLKYIQKMIKESIDKLNKIQIYELFLEIPFDDELKHITNIKMSNSFDRNVSINYILSENYSASYEEEVNLLTYIFSEKNNYDLNKHCNKILKSGKFNILKKDDNTVIPTILMSACNSNKGKIIYDVSRRLGNLSEKSIDLIIQTLMSINDFKHLYLLVSRKKLDNDNIYKIIKFICDSKEDEYIYKVSLLFPEYKELYRKTLFESSNRYYLILYMIYVDEYLIHMIFSSTEKMIEYMKLYDFDLKDIRYVCIKYGYNINDILSPKDEVDKNIKNILLKLDCK